MPVIPSLVLTNQLPINTYTASVIISASAYQGRPSAIPSDGLGNQIVLFDTTCSYALSSSYEQEYEISSSYASSSTSASYLTNERLRLPYLTLTAQPTISLNFFTCSNQYVNISSAATYSLSSSNPPPVGYTSDVLLMVSHSAAALPSYWTIPSNWINVSNAGWPLSIAANKLAVFWIRSVGGLVTIGTYNANG